MHKIAIPGREPGALQNWKTVPNVGASHKAPLSTEVLEEENRI
jgi:hypothetical protein